MAKFDNPLNNIRIASPCSQDWNAMVGNERRRYCGECKLNVYNLSAMSRAEAENLIQTSEGRLCVRYYKRPDGSVITEDCPVGLAKIRQRTRVFLTAAASLIFSFLGAIGLQTTFGKTTFLSANFPIPFVTPTPERLMGGISPTTPTPTPKATPTPREFVMGDVAEPTPKPTPKKEGALMGKVAPTGN